LISKCCSLLTNVSRINGNGSTFLLNLFSMFSFRLRSFFEWKIFLFFLRFAFSFEFDVSSAVELHDPLVEMGWWGV
jgi:hypothetical protein